MNRSYRTSYDPNGPAVILGTSSSIFPRQLARYWKSVGIPVTIVCHDATDDTITSDGINIVSSSGYHSALIKLLLKFYRLFHWCEIVLVKCCKSNYRRRTGRKEPDPWEPYFVANFLTSFGAAKAAMSLRPRFVFGQEVGCYGLPSSYCTGVPKFLFPWGADVFLSAETSPIYYRLIQYALRKADVVLPASVTAARHISERFAVPAEKVVPLSWGVDLTLFGRASEKERQRILDKLSISSDAMIISNPRRFRPSWGCFDALTAFMMLAEQRPQLHFIMVGGLGTESHVKEACDLIKKKGLQDRFTIFEKDIPITEFADIMSVTDVFVSLLGRGDMRSASVLQAAAAGAVPVLVSNSEYEEMTKTGFKAHLISSIDPEQVRHAIELYLDEPASIAATRTANYDFLHANEDSNAQMAKMLELMEKVCLQYERDLHEY